MRIFIAFECQLYGYAYSALLVEPIGILPLCGLYVYEGAREDDGVCFLVGGKLSVIFIDIDKVGHVVEEAFLKG
jgi:hypothetical protein